jgi:outer membrane protein assembly factor BamB
LNERLLKYAVATTVVLLVVVGGAGYWWVSIHQRISTTELGSSLAESEGLTSVACIEQASNGGRWICAGRSEAGTVCRLVRVKPWGSWKSRPGFQRCAKLGLTPAGKQPPRRERSDWPAYLFSGGHSSYSRDARAITASNVDQLAVAWKFKADKPAIDSLGGFHATPIVIDGTIYIGARNGLMYALNGKTGKVIWKRPLGYRKALTCGAEGFTSSAAVVKNPHFGWVVYAASANGRLYAMDARTGRDVWSPANVYTPSKTENDYYQWSSPVVADGRVYVAISSHCDAPLVPGGVRSYSADTGNLIADFRTVGFGEQGGSIWSTPAWRDGSIWVTTGNSPTGDGFAIVRLNGKTLQRQDIWRVPERERVLDSDFGASPTFFAAKLNGKVTELIGACNKNGRFYAWRASNLHAGPVWTRTIGEPYGTGHGFCNAGAIWNGNHLFVAGNTTRIDGKEYRGSIRELDPATGTIVWETGLEAGAVLGTPTQNGSGVIAVSTYDDENALYLIDSRNGRILRTLTRGITSVFAQPVFADGRLFVASRGSGFVAFALGP